MSWLAVVAAALGLVRSLIEFLHERQRIDAATAEVLLKSSREACDAIDKARKAREDVRGAAAHGADPMSDDGFKRQD